VQEVGGAGGVGWNNVLEGGGVTLEGGNVKKCGGWRSEGEFRNVYKGEGLVGLVLQRGGGVGADTAKGGGSSFYCGGGWGVGGVTQNS
jgi:hypothetical protein